MINQLKWVVHLLLISNTVLAITHEMDVVDHGETFMPMFDLKQPIQSEDALKSFRSYVMWQKLSADLNRSAQVLANSFGALKVPNEQDMSTISIEQLKLRSIIAEIELEKRIICAMLSFMKILLIIQQHKEQ